MTLCAKTLLVLCFPFILLTDCSQRNDRNGSQGTANRLANARSPYLKEHADNPVDWYEWGDEALEKAMRENKSLIISIGYASCHWCHVMEKESFMDTAVARLNEYFVSIKIDREERPDIDQIYIEAAQLISGNSGWPLNAFALPDGKPFYAATYFPKEQWMSMLRKVAEAYGKDAREKAMAIQHHYLPTSIFMGGENEDLPLLENKRVARRTMIYVCRNKTCKVPEEEVGRALVQLEIK